MQKIKNFFIRIYNAVFGFGSRFIIRLGTRVGFRIKFYFHDRKVQGRRLKQPLVIVSNHVNYKDGAVIGITFPTNKIYSLTAKDLFEHSRAKKWNGEKNGNTGAISLCASIATNSPSSRTSAPRLSGRCKSASTFTNTRFAITHAWRDIFSNTPNKSFF